MSKELPANWESWRLGDAGEWTGGGTPLSTNSDFWEGDILWVSPKDMKVGQITCTQERITRAAIANSAAKLLPENSVLFVTRSGILAHSFPVAIAKLAVTINQDLKAITPVEVIQPEYLAWALRAAERQVLQTCSKHGTTVHSIEIPALKDFRIPIPPTNEQARIVAKIEELFSELDKGVENFSAAQQQFKTYRQAVLKHAFEGKLTADWRAQNPDKLETSETLLSRIRAERETRYAEELSERESATAQGRWGSNSSQRAQRLRPLTEVSPLALDVMKALPEVPKCWSWAKLAWLTGGVDYGTAEKSSKTGATPVIRMGNLQNGAIDWSDLAFTDDLDQIAQYKLRDGDILFNRTNSPELVGKAAIYKGERQAIFAGYLIRINHNPRTVDGEYLNFFLNAHLARQYGNSVKTDGVNQSNINGEKLQSYPFPYCSLAEQRVIVKRLNERTSGCDAILGLIEEERNRVAALRQSILEKAFSGQLVPQDPNDEPASGLLERMRSKKPETVIPKKNNRREKDKAA